MNTNNKQDNWTLRDLWEILMNNIWLYILSCSVAVAVAAAYIVVTPPQYERTASILIKSEEQDPMSKNFADIGMMQSNTDINNEIRILKTKTLMSEVVSRLGLDYIYKQNKKGLRWVDIYKRTPFVVVPDSTLAPLTFSFDISFENDDEFQITNLEVESLKVELDDVLTGKINSHIQTPYGAITILSTPFFATEDLDGEEFSFAKAKVGSIASEYISRLRVNASSSSKSIVELYFTDERLERADNVLNTLISVYNENWIKDRNEITFNTSEFIDSRLRVIEQELESVDGSIAKFKSDKLIPNIEAVSGIHLQQTTQNKSEQLVIKNRLSMASYVQEYLSNVMSSDQLLPANTGIENAMIESKIAEYNELLLQKNILQANSSANNPLVADMISNLSAIKAIINTSLRDHISTLKLQLSNLQAQESLNIQNLSSTPQQAKELLSVERQQMIKEQLFLYLLQKREENELSQAFSAYNTKILSAADGSSNPKEPKKSMIIMLALAIGVIIPTLYVIIKEAFDTLINSKRDLEGLNIPYVGSIPFVSSPKCKKSGLPFTLTVSAGSRDINNEAFRVLRTNIDFMIDSNKQSAQVIQLISLLPGSGKSFITTNLALSMALKDSKVLVIDCDIRKRTISKYMTTNKIMGLSDYLSDKVDSIESLLIKGTIDQNLDILPVGTTPPNPSELLLKPRFEEVINLMKSRYDYIFIDCPPVEIVPDAAIVGRFCDTSIFVIKAANVDKRLLPEIESIYASKKYNNMCLLLNGVKNEGKGYYGYGRKGYYGYGAYTE